MNRYFSIIAFVVVASYGQVQGQNSTQADRQDSLFGLENVIDFHIHIEPDEWAKLQPPKGTKMDFGVAMQGIMLDAITGGNFRRDESVRPGVVGYLGVNHQYGLADVVIDGEAVEGIGLRYKGNGTFLEYVEGDVTRRLSFKVDINEFDDDLEFRGLSKINLNNNTTDPSLMREALSYELFREAGIPCSRVGYAKVSLTIRGEIDRQPHGLYTVVEQVDKRFLKERFGSAKGLLMKPGTFGVFRYFGDDWDEYEIAYVPKTEPTEEQKQRVIEFAELVHKSKDKIFEEKVEDYLDVDQFLRFVAVNVLLCNLDSFLSGAQNYYVYLEPESNKFHFLPWDMDHSLGAFVFMGTPEMRQNLSIDHPGGKGHRLIERVLNIPRYKTTYNGLLETYMDTIFDEEKVHQQVTRVGTFVRPLVEMNGSGATDGFDEVLADTPRDPNQQPIKHFVSKRCVSVRQQLDGESEGVILFERPPTMVELIGLGSALVLVLVFNFSAWIWGIVAGFRGRVLWGFLNLFFYPVTPVIYGFKIQRELGRRSAIWTLFSIACFVMLIVMGVIVGSQR